SAFAVSEKGAGGALFRCHPPGRTRLLWLAGQLEYAVVEAAQTTARSERRLDSDKARRIVAAMRASVAQRGAAGSTFDHVAQEAEILVGKEREGIVRLRADAEAVVSIFLALADGLEVQLTTDPEWPSSDAVLTAVSVARFLLGDPVKA